MVAFQGTQNGLAGAVEATFSPVKENIPTGLEIFLTVLGS